MKTLIVCSGGLDSVVLAHMLYEAGEAHGLVTFDYGQRHKKELGFAAKCAERLSLPHHILDISTIGKSLSGSALTDDLDVPDGHYAEQTMKVTIVPNRNAIMLAIAFGVAAAEGAEAVATAVHGGDHFIYPDCRPGFIDAFSKMQEHALDGYADIKLRAPFVNVGKEAIAARGAALGVPFEETWSCYKGGDVHCGSCGTCVERREAFYLAGVDDPTPYENDNYWKAAIERKAN